MKVLFVAGMAPIVSDREASLQFYERALGLPLQHDDDSEYVSTEVLDVGLTYTPSLREGAGSSSPTDQG
jgi:catechol 2,3-dioxygenase-like lactoylglutathione lyase family enzyme